MLPAVQDGRSGCALLLTADSADAESRGDRDAILRVRDVEPEQAGLRQGTEGSLLHVPSMPWPAEPEAR